jgi:hypothetical protein
MDGVLVNVGSLFTFVIFIATKGKTRTRNHPQEVQAK